MKTNTNKFKKYSIAAIILGYTLAIGFIILIAVPREVEEVEPVVASIDNINEDDMFITSPSKLDIVTHTPREVYIDRGVYNDRLTGGIVNGRLDPYTVIIHEDDDIYVDTKRNVDIINIDDDISLYNRNNFNHLHDGHVSKGTLNRYQKNRDGNGKVSLVDDVDHGLLDRRLLEHENRTELDNNRVRDHSIRNQKHDEDLSQLTLARDEDISELGDVTDLEFTAETKGYNTGPGGELYAYSFPSQGVGAGIGSGALGAGAGGSAGLGAGVGEAVLAGKTVPTLGGIGTYSSVPTVPPGTGTDTDGDGLSTETEVAIGTDPNKADTDGDGFTDGAEATSYTNPLLASSNPSVPGSETTITMGGTGGLVGGAGAGGAAGLVTGMVKDILGIGTGTGTGAGGGGYNYDHLPKDGALHIMMHVDGSGSILNTRKQLEIMKNTLLKTALLPYYNNDEELYDRRVTIISSSGERTLKFFEEAAKKDNVLAIAFQDEAQPAYHLPNFNKRPEEFYLDDLNNLKASLNGYDGVYRGVMFQVDRGKTFAKSFKEFVGNAFRGEGYLESDNLKRYYKDNNTANIKNKDGVVFSDEYHAKDSGTPQYYLDLILNASSKIGLDLQNHAGGLTDGRYNEKIN
tara:strand:+ start:654 stop:2540 length:1887 start_codon:yes stop_codon:yes gene_type:complete